MGQEWEKLLGIAETKTDQLNVGGVPGVVEGLLNPELRQHAGIVPACAYYNGGIGCDQVHRKTE